MKKSLSGPDSATVSGTPFPRRAVRRFDWLWLAALVAVLSLHLWFPRIDPGGLNDTYSVEVGGRNAFYQLAATRFDFVERNLLPLTVAVPSLDPTDVLCLLGPARYPTATEWDALLNWVADGGSLLIAARWDDPQFEIDRLDVTVVDAHESSPKEDDKNNAPMKAEKDQTTPQGETARKAKSIEKRIVEHIKTLLPVTTRLLPDVEIQWRSQGTIAAPNAETLVEHGADPQAVRVVYGAGRIVVIASDYVFSNESLALADKQNGSLAFRLLEAAGATDTVVFDESLNMTGTPKVVGLLFDPLLRPITVQLVAVLLIFAWRGNRRFGGVLPQAAAARHDIALHTNALGNLHYKVGDGRTVLRAYLDQLRTELRLKVYAGQERRLLAPVARKLGKSVDEVLEQLARAETAVNAPRLPRREAARTIRNLALIRRADLRTPV